MRGDEKGTERKQRSSGRLPERPYVLPLDAKKRRQCMWRNLVMAIVAAAWRDSNDAGITCR